MRALPDDLVRACARYVHDHDPLPMRRAIDRLVTTPQGYDGAHSIADEHTEDLAARLIALAGG